MEVRHTQCISQIMTAMREEGTLDWTTVVDGSLAVERAKASQPDGTQLRAERLRGALGLPGQPEEGFQTGHGAPDIHHATEQHCLRLLIQAVRL
jgi:hypothetical protein